MNKISFFLFLSFLLYSMSLFSQSNLRGKVIDAYTEEPLAFVNIVYNSKNLGTTTDLDGNFNISDVSKIEFLSFSYLGYTTKTILRKDIINKSFIKVEIQPDMFILSEVNVLPGENPAHRIINLVIENSKKNNPENVRSFSYRSYNKFYFTVVNPKKPQIKSGDEETTSQTERTDTEIKNNDSINIIVDTIREQESLEKILSKQHLFITESVTKRDYKYPGNNHEEVVANRMSGLKKPEFAVLATQLQSFSFYKDFISVFDKKYLSPIGKGSTKRYFYQIEDTIYNEVGDSIFLIFYRPYKGKNFDGLTGMLHINSNGYALQSVTASPYDRDASMEISIQQKYELIDSIQWFPVQLNTNLTFNSILVEIEDEGDGALVGVGKSYISEIDLHPHFKRSQFSQVEVKINKDANDKDTSFWNQYRAENFTEKELNTYRVIDSLGEEHKYDRKLEMLKVLMSGKLPIYFVDIDLLKIIDYNKYEGFKLGAALETNNNLFSWMKLSGWFNYGFKDKAFKYGGSTKFLLHRPSATSVSLSYIKGLRKSDLLHIDKKDNFARYLTKMYTSEYDSITELSASFSFSPIKYLRTELSFSYQDHNIINLNRYDYINSINKHFFTSEVSLSCRYAYKEKFFELLSGNRVSLGTEYPILYFNVIKGLNAFMSNNEYLKLEASISKIVEWRMLGDTYLKMSGTNILGDIPYSMLYSVPANFTLFFMDNYFNTMRINEFVVDRYASLYIKHDFRSLFYKTEKWAPRFAVFTMLAWGDCSRIAGSNAPQYAKTMNKGYYESGINIDNLLSSSFSKIGVSVSYRYGPYAFLNELRNFSFQFLISHPF